MRTKLEKCLAWILLLPLSALGALFAYFSVIYASSQFFISTNPEAGTPFIIVMPAIFLACAAFIGIGWKIAPTFKQEITISLSILVSTLCGVNLVFALLDYQGWECVKYVLYSVSGIVSSIITCILAYKSVE